MHMMLNADGGKDMANSYSVVVTTIWIVKLTKIQNKLIMKMCYILQLRTDINLMDYGVGLIQSHRAVVLFCQVSYTESI